MIGFLFVLVTGVTQGFSGGSGWKDPPASAGDTGDAVSMPGSGKSPGGGNSTPLQYSYLENPMDRGAWWATVHGVRTCGYPHKSLAWLLLFGHSVLSDSLQPHGLQHSRLPCPPPTPRVCSNSCPLSHWCHPTISSSVIPFSSSLLFFSPSGSFKMSQLFISGGHSNGASDSASVHQMNIQGWFNLGLTGLISLQSNGLSRVFSNTTVQKHQCFGAHPSLWSISHIHTWLLEKSWLWQYSPLSAN